MRRLIGALALCVAGLLAFSYAGAWHPAGDSFAVFRPALAVGLVLAAAVMAGPKWVRALTAGLAVASLAMMVFPSRLRPLEGAYDFALYQQNTLYNRSEFDGWIAAVEEAEAEFVTLQEMSIRNHGRMSELILQYPTVVSCPNMLSTGVMVLSKYSAVEDSAFCSQNGDLAAVQVETERGPVWIASLHLRWPWPFSQPEQVLRLVPDLQRLSGPSILAGDFNSVRWSHAVAQVAEASGTGYAGPHAATFHLEGIYPIGIDHVLTAGLGVQEVKVMPKLGADHHGILARFSWRSDL